MFPLQKLHKLVLRYMVCSKLVFQVKNIYWFGLLSFTFCYYLFFLGYVQTSFFPPRNDFTSPTSQFYNTGHVQNQYFKYVLFLVLLVDFNLLLLSLFLRICSNIILASRNDFTSPTSQFYNTGYVQNQYFKYVFFLVLLVDFNLLLLFLFFLRICSSIILPPGDDFTSPTSQFYNTWYVQKQYFKYYFSQFCLLKPFVTISIFLRIFSSIVLPPLR